MNRKPLIIGGILLVVVLAFCVVVAFFVWNKLTKNSPEAGQGTHVTALMYCSDDENKPCVVSFGSDSDGNMLVNLLLPDISYPPHLLKITYKGAAEPVTYTCRRVTSAPNSAYCVGPLIAPGQTLHLMLVAIKNDTLLAEGDLSIIGMAFPTIEIVSPTPGIPLTETAVFPEPTEAPDFLLPTSTPLELVLPTPTPTQPAYPNPSYPNPSYP